MSVSLLLFNISSLLFPSFFALLCSEKQQTTHPLWMSLSLQPTKVLMNRGIVRGCFVLSPSCLTVREHSANNRHPAVPEEQPLWLCLCLFGNKASFSPGKKNLKASPCPLCAFSASLWLWCSLKEDFGLVCPALVQRRMGTESRQH